MYYFDPFGAFIFCRREDPFREGGDESARRCLSTLNLTSSKYKLH
jgi:hypothetical protein